MKGMRGGYLVTSERCRVRLARSGAAGGEPRVDGAAVGTYVRPLATTLLLLLLVVGTAWHCHTRIEVCCSGRRSATPVAAAAACWDSLTCVRTVSGS